MSRFVLYDMTRDTTKYSPIIDIFFRLKLATMNIRHLHLRKNIAFRGAFLPALSRKHVIFTTLRSNRNLNLGTEKYHVNSYSNIVI